MESNIVLDLDGVLFNFIQGIIDYGKKHGFTGLPASAEEVKKWWFFDYRDQVWQQAKDDPEFWLGIKPLNNAHEKLAIIPRAYLTARPCPNEISEESLYMSGFPTSRVITVPRPIDKVNYMQEFENCILVDDHIETIETLINAGGTGVLYKAGWHGELQTDHLPVIETVEEINLLGGALKYKEYRRQLNVKS